MFFERSKIDMSLAKTLQYLLFQHSLSFERVFEIKNDFLRSRTNFFNENVGLYCDLTHFKG